MAPRTIAAVSTTSKTVTEIIENKPKKPPKKYKYFVFGEFQTELKWLNIVSISLLHILVLYGLVTYPYIQKFRLVPYQFLIGGLAGFGVTAGAHRYWTHRSFKAKLPLQIILMICYAIAGQNTIIEWVKDHRVHHKFSETDADPHNSKRGFFFSHMGWLMMKKHPDVIRKGKTIDCTDVTEDKLVKIYTKYFTIIKLCFCMLIPVLIPYLLWNESLYYSFMSSLGRYVVGLHCTWSVNSFAHIWGYKPYDRTIKPTDNWKVSLVALGEGWHNYHHTFPWDYRASELGQYFNVTTSWLDLFAKIGWAYDMKSPTEELVRKMIEKHGDGSHHHHHHQHHPSYY